MYSQEMDFIKDDLETLPNKVMDKIWVILKSSYKGIGQENLESESSLNDDLTNLIQELLNEDKGYTCLLWAGIIIGKSIIPTIEKYDPNNDLLDVVLGLVCGHCFTYAAVNESYAKNKILLPPIHEDIRARLFVEKYSLENIITLDNNQYKDALLIYHHLLGLCINPSVTNDMVKIITLFIERDVITDNIKNKKVLLDWIAGEVISSAWERRIPVFMYDIKNLNHK